MTHSLQHFIYPCTLNEATQGRTYLPAVLSDSPSHTHTHTRTTGRCSAQPLHSVNKRALKLVRETGDQLVKLHSTCDGEGRQRLSAAPLRHAVHVYVISGAVRQAHDSVIA